MNISIVYTLSNRKASKIFFYGLACAYMALLLLHVIFSQFKGITVISILIGLYFVRHLNGVLNHPKYQGTVKNYLSDIYTKIGTNDRAKAVLLLKRYLST